MLYGFIIFVFNAVYIKNLRIGVSIFNAEK